MASRPGGLILWKCVYLLYVSTVSFGRREITAERRQHASPCHTWTWDLNWRFSVHLLKEATDGNYRNKILVPSALKNLINSHVSNNGFCKSLNLHMSYYKIIHGFLTFKLDYWNAMYLRQRLNYIWKLSIRAQSHSLLFWSLQSMLCLQTALKVLQLRGSCPCISRY